MTHIPQERVFIVVPFYQWGIEVRRTYLTKLIEKFGEENVRSLQQQIRIITPGQGPQVLTGFSGPGLLLVHKQWQQGCHDFEERRSMRHHLMHLCSVGYTVEYIDEDYYR